jgi:hypothetical protein
VWHALREIQRCLDLTTLEYDVPVIVCLNGMCVGRLIFGGSRGLLRCTQAGGNVRLMLDASIFDVLRMKWLLTGDCSWGNSHGRLREVMIHFPGLISMAAILVR